MRAIPTYALYGEADEHLGADWLHCETIQARSRLHDYRIEPHRHDTFFQILHLAAGTAEAVLDGRTETLVPPCLVLVPPLTVHGYAFSHDVQGQVLTLVARHVPQVLRACPEAAAGLDRPVHVPLGEHADLADTVARELDAAAREFSQRRPGQLAIVEARIAIALVLAFRVRSADGGAVPDPARRGALHVARFRDLVDLHYRERLSIEDYAGRLGLTTAHLNRLCRTHLGQSALGVVQARIVLEAKRYLAFTTLGIKEIADAVGFEDAAYFTRFFRRETRLAPTEFRARRLGAAGDQGQAANDDGASVRTERSSPVR